MKKKTPPKRKKASKSSVKDLPPRKGMNVKGGSFFSDIVGSVSKNLPG